MLRAACGVEASLSAASALCTGFRGAGRLPAFRRGSLVLSCLVLSCLVSTPSQLDTSSQRTQSMPATTIVTSGDSKPNPQDDAFLLHPEPSNLYVLLYFNISIFPYFYISIFLYFYIPAVSTTECGGRRKRIQTNASNTNQYDQCNQCRPMQPMHTNATNANQCKPTYIWVRPISKPIWVHMGPGLGPGP